MTDMSTGPDLVPFPPLRFGRGKMTIKCKIIIDTAFLKCTYVCLTLTYKKHA